MTQAASFGSTTCSSTSTTSCVGGTYVGLTVSVGDTLDTTPDEKILNLSSGLWNTGYSLTVNASKSVVITKRGSTADILIQNGAVANLKFGNSVYKGSFTMNYSGGVASKADLSFDGNYQGNSDDTLKGYAFVGGIAVNLGTMTASFKNDANMKGDISSTNPYNNNISANANINFIGSSLEGNINTRDTGDSLNNPATQNITFDGNSSKGFAMKGSVNNRYGTTNITFNNGAKMVGDLTVGGSAYARTGSVNASFNGSSFAGKINTATNNGQFRLTAKDNSTINVESLTGAGGGYDGDMGFTLDNSILQGNTDESKISYINTNDKSSITATNNSKVYMNLTSAQNPSFRSKTPSTSVSLTKSEWIGDVTINYGTVNFELKSSKMTGNISGNGNLQGYFTDSTIDNITNNNSASVLNFYHTAPVAGTPDTNPITIGNITFSGKITGNIANANIGDIKLSSNSGISSDLALTKSYLNSIFLDSGAKIKFSAIDSTIGKDGNTGMVIYNNWGTFDATINNSVVNGSIGWGDANFANSTDASKGLNFINGSTLNGNIVAPTNGNVSTSNIFSFDASTMKGNIVLNEKSKAGTNNSISVNFTSQSTFVGDITGDANIQANFDNSTLKSNLIQNNNTTSTLNFKDAKDSSIGKIDFAGAITGSLKHSDIGSLNNSNTSSSLTLTNEKTDKSLDINAKDNSPINTIGDVTFAGTLNTTLHSSAVNSLNLSGTSNLSFSDNSKIGTLNINGGTSSLTLDNQSILGGLNVIKGISNVNAKSGSLLLSTIGVSADGATSNVSFSSDASASGNIDFSKVNGVIMQKLQDIAKQNLDAKAPIDGSAPSSDVIPPKDDSSKDAFSKEQLTALISMLKPQDILSYLSSSNISSYAGNILTSGGSNDVNFKDSLYLGGNINTTSGTANITMSFSTDFISKLQGNSLTNAFLYGGSGPEFSVTTNGENATNNIALSGSIKGVAQVNYLAGNTNIVFADGSTGSFIGGNSTNFSDKDVFDPNGSDNSKKQVMINGQTYEGGIYVKLDASKADTILKNYRNLFPINTTTFMIDKVTNPDVYTATISGAMIGEVSSLPASTSVKSYQAIFKDNSLFIGRLNITDTNVSIDLSQGSKLILEDGSNISVLSSAFNKDGTKKSFYLDSRDLTGDSIYQSNTIIDLATGGNPSSSSQIKSSYSTLNIGEVKDLNNAIFRISYNPFSEASDAQKDKTDHIIINSASSSSGIQNDYLQAYQNSLSPVLGDLRDKKILVVSIKNDFTPKGATEKTAGLAFNTDSTVLQGYDLIQTIFDKKIENSNDGTDTVATGSSDTWTNYYIAAAKAKISESSKDLTQAAISSNYSIFLANINDLNKRLGELRNNTNAQGVWARVFNGMTTNNRGEEVKTYSTNVQAGYDISLPNASLDGKSYLGFALSYGYNTLSSKSFTGKANLLEVGAYYSYVGNTGFYNDTILKYSFISNDLTLQNNENKNNTFNSSTASLGEELGYRFYFNLKETQTSKHSLYLEPSAEVIFGYVGNGGFDQINGNAFLNAAINNILAFRGRVGGVLGYSLKTANNQTDFRVGLSYVNDIVGGGKINFKTNFSDAELDLQSNQMALVSVGVNSILSDRWKVYADVETSFGGTYYNQNYLVSVGGRYAFGKKTNFVQNNQTKPSSSVSDIKAGYYFDVYTLAKNAKLSKEQISLLSKYPHAVLLEKETFVDPRTKNQKTIEVQKILIGPFKTKEGAEKSQNIADEIAKILNKKETKALLKEVE